MTHDQREALEPVLSFLDELAANAAPGKRAALNPILIGGSAKLYAEGLREALTASPGEQEPCGWQFCCPDGKWIGCDEPPANELRDEPEKFRRVYLSPPPAAGWNGGKNHD